MPHDDSITSKVCPMCKILKPEIDFYKNKKTGRLLAYCKSCSSKRYNSINKERYRTDEAFREQIRSRAKNRSRDRKQEYEKDRQKRLSDEDYKRRITERRSTPEYKERVREYYEKNKNKQRARDLERNMRTYGLTTTNYNDILSDQGGVCAICKTNKPHKREDRNFVVDHDHETLEVRGLLCYRCNVGLGVFGDNLAGIMRAVAYLEAALLKNRLTRHSDDGQHDGPRGECRRLRLDAHSSGDAGGL